MVFTFKTRKGNYHSASVTWIVIPVLALIIAVGVSIAAAVCQAKYEEYFNQAYKAVTSGKNSVLMKKSLLSEMAVKRCMFSTPELFTVDKYRYTYFDDTVFYEFITNGYASDYEGNLEKYNEAIDEIVAKAPKFSGEREAVKWIHDYIIENYEYDHSLASGNALSMIETGRGTCNAYTGLFSALAGRLGIEYGVKMNQSHTWNTVKIGAFWYHIDVTWDDRGSEPVYDYYLKSDAVFATDGHLSWEDTGVSLAFFEELRNVLILIAAAFFLVMSVFSILPMVYAYFRK